MNVASTAARITRKIAEYGEVLPVSRSGALGTTASKHNITALPQAASADTASKWAEEAGLNLSEGMPTMFTVALAEDLLEGDEITYDLYVYDVRHITPVRLAGVTVARGAICVRLRAA